MIVILSSSIIYFTSRQKYSNAPYESAVNHMKQPCNVYYYNPGASVTTVLSIHSQQT